MVSVFRSQPVRCDAKIALPDGRFLFTIPSARIPRLAPLFSIACGPLNSGKYEGPDCLRSCRQNTREVALPHPIPHFPSRPLFLRSCTVLCFPRGPVRDSLSVEQPFVAAFLTLPRFSGAPPMKLSDVAEKLSCRLEGDPSAEITGIAGMDHASPGQITFLANRRYFPLLRTTRATAIFVEAGIRLEREPGLAPLAALRSSNPYLAFARAIELFYQPPVYAAGIHPTAVVAKSARIGSGSHIGPYC